MNLYPNAVLDARTKAMLPVAWGMTDGKCPGMKTLIDNRNTQIYLKNQEMERK